MRALTMGVMPGPLGVRVLVQDERSRTVLKAVLPCAPQDGRALGLLCEALALWCRGPVHAALCADDSEVLSDTSSWLESIEAESPLYDLKVVVGHEFVADADVGCELGEFDDVRAFVRRWVEP